MFKRKRAVPEPDPAPPARREPPVYVQGFTLMPDEGAALRIDSAADVDPNIKKWGGAGIPRGGAGGYGGAGTH